MQMHQTELKNSQIHVDIRFWSLYQIIVTFMNSYAVLDSVLKLFFQKNKSIS
jgi:hypothetical protein